MKSDSRSAFTLTALAALALVSAGGCGGRTYGRGLRRLASFGVRAGFIDFRDFKLQEVEDRPMAGLYLRFSTKGRTIIELSVDAAFDPDVPDEQFYLGGLSVLFFPTERGGVYFHVGGGAMSEAQPINDYIDGYAAAGVGYTMPAGNTRLDVRATVWQMINSANITRAYVVTVGYGF